MSVIIFDSMLGRIMTSVTTSNDEMVFTAFNGMRFRFHHEQDCCESVYIEDIAGDLADLIGEPILEAQEVSNMDAPPLGESIESYTWTFYKFSTSKGSVTVRWLGTSNGYYSESVSFEELK